MPYQKRREKISWKAGWKAGKHNSATAQQQTLKDGYLLSDYENAAGTGQVHVWFDVDSSNSSSSSSMPPLSKL